MRLAFVTSHPIQYYAPLFRALAQRLDLVVYFAHCATPHDQAKAGFGVEFEWDIGLLSGYSFEFLSNRAKYPGLHHFAGCDTPGVGEVLRKGRFDAVLVQGWYLKSFLQAIIAAKYLRMPLLVRGDSHLDTPRTLLKRAAKSMTYPVFFRAFDAALYVGQRSRAYWSRYRYPGSRLFFSPHCVDADWFRRRASQKLRAELRSNLGIAPQTKVLLFAGKLVPFKRPLDVVQAAARLKEAGHQVCVLVAGAGPLEAKMLAAARAASIQTHMLGFCNQSAMPEAYAAADVLVLPSDGRETWGLVANEALACGCPVVLSDAVGSAPDLVGDGSAGRIFPVANVRALAYAITDLFASPPSVEAIAAKSAVYSLQTAADGILSATEFVAKGRLPHTSTS